MVRRFKFDVAILMALFLAAGCRMAAADTIGDALLGGKINADFRLRYEHVDQRNALKAADALTLRSVLGYTTGDFLGLSAKLEFEDVREVADIDNYNDGLGSEPQYSVVADPQTTELEQGYLQYRAAGATARLGRQVITLDNHRFVGDVGWRQDHQTFDAFSVDYRPIDDLKLTYAYLFRRNRIFAEERDLKSKDHLLHAAFLTPLGTLTGYAYLLGENEGVKNDIDSYGARFSGSTDVAATRILYTAEFAYQDAASGGSDFDALYYLVEGGAEFAGVTARAGYEVLGSDNGRYGFSTPLATLHKFNGWSDQFLTTPNQGLTDLYGSLGAKLMGVNLELVYHSFDADDATAGVDDLGRELDAVASIKFLKHYNAGIKYANYWAGDSGSGKVDTEKIWTWVGVTF